MSKTTLWYVNDEKKTFSDFNTILNKKIKNGFHSQFNDYPGFQMEELVRDDTLVLDSIKVLYCLYECSVTNSSGDLIHFLIIIFETNGRIGFIIEKTSGALKLLRLLFDYGPADKLVITQENYPSSSDVEKIFLLIIYKIYSKSGTITKSYKKKNLKIILDSLDGIKGKTSGTLNSVSTQGNDVINMLSTLSFLLESSMLSDITVAFSFNRNDNISTVVHTNNSQSGITQLSIDVSEKKYSGYLRKSANGFLGSDLDFKKLRAKILLIVHLEVMAIIYSQIKVSQFTRTKAVLKKQIVNDLKNKLSKI